MTADQFGKALHVDRLGDEPIKTGLVETLAIFLHDRGGHRDDRDRCGRWVRAQLLERRDAVHAWELDIHEDEPGPALAGEGDAVFGVGRFDRLEPVMA